MLSHRQAHLDEVTLHYVQSGEGPLIVLLHGFPEFWYSWHKVIPELADAGYQVVAPDMRGYNQSDKPEGVAAYRRSKLVGDVVQLIGELGVDEATVVGHDWGGAVAWSVAIEHPEMVTDLAVMNGPHPVTMVEGLKNPRQLLKSWYILFFQLPWLPELSLGFADCAMLRRVFRNEPVNEDAFSEDDIDKYVEAFRDPHARRATINYYRAAARYGIDEPRRVIDHPVLVIHGEQDPYLGPDVAKPPVEWVPECRYEPVADASHWIQMDRPERVSDLLLDHLTRK